MPNDREIAKGYAIKPIEKIAESAGIPARYLEKYGPYKAKILWSRPIKELPKRGKLIICRVICKSYLF